MNFLKFSLLVILISVIVGLTPPFLKFAFNNSQPTEVIAFKTSQRKTDKIGHIIAGKAKIPIYLADTEDKRIKGLGGLSSIPRGYGMFFIFDSSGYQSIWMKDMLFSVDIIWIDENNKIVHIEKNISPDTYPKIFTAPAKARFVLELNAGMSESYDLKADDKLTLVQK